MTAMGRNGDDYILSDEQIRQYHEQGYLVLSDVVTEDEIVPIEREFERFKRGEFQGMGRDFCDMSGPFDRKFEDYNLINAMLPRVYAAETVADNIFERRAASISRQLIGEDAVLDYDQFLAKKPGREGAIFSWHQDLGYWPKNAPDNRTATVSLALDDADTENGCLRVVPGSHRESELRPHRPLISSGTGEREEGHALSVTLTDADPVVELPVKRGDVTVHNERIVHGSGGNVSSRWRRTYVIAFRSRACVDYERSIGFTHSHNDKVNWDTFISTENA